MIELKSAAEIARMRSASRVTGEILGALRDLVRPGVTTGELDREAERMIGRQGAKSAFKGYRVGDDVFPAVLCASVNDEVVHGIPSMDREVVEGDLLKLDFGVIVDGYYGDSAVTVPVGKVDDDNRRLLEVTRDAMYSGIELLRPGKRLGDVGAAVQQRCESEGFGVVRDFVGHGIGRALHEDPQVPNFGRPGRGRRLQVGMVLALEPMVNMGGAGVKMDSDGWTARTADGSRSAHFEHTVAITRDGPVILTEV